MESSAQPDETSLLRLARAVADGADVDWAHAESSAADEGARAAIQQLRRLAGICDAAREHVSTWGSLEIRGEVGHGSFGTVYRAWDTRLQRVVALKLLTGEHAQRQLTSTVIKEGRLLAQVRHPNVVTVHGADAIDGHVGIWMEFVVGQTLKEILQQHGPFGPQEAALVGRDVCRALAAVHRQGFLHRDIKAQNVMREAGGRTVLMDFGAGSPMAGEDAQGRIIGTPAYLAPEVLAGTPPSVQSDIYSLGVLLFHLVTGEFPVSAQTVEEIRAIHADRRWRRLRDVRPELPSAFVHVVERSTAADPADRPASAGELEVLLEAALDLSGGVPAAGHGPAWTERSYWVSGPRALRHSLTAATGLAIVVVGLVAGVARWPPSLGSVIRGNSVAILPFRNLTAAPDTEYFSDGVTEDLAAHLSALGDLRVVYGASALQYRDRRKTPTEVGAELGVATVLDGSVRRVGDRVRIASQLIDATTGEQLWSGSFDRELGDIFAMQSEVSLRIAEALKGELNSADAQRLRSAQGRDFEVFNLYLKGRHEWALRTEDSLNRSVQFFQQAIARDSRYAPAHVGLADAYMQMGVYGFLPQVEAYERAAAYAEKAVALEESLAEAHASLGFVRKNRLEWKAAETSFRRAIELKPGYAPAHHWYSIYLTQVGRFPEAITEIKTAISLDPIAIGAHGQLGSVLAMARRYEDAAAQFERLVRFNPDFGFAYRALAQTYTHMGRFDRARAALDEALKRAPIGAEDRDLKDDLGYLLATSGDAPGALAIARDLEHRYERTGESVAVNVAAIHAGLKQTDRALEWLTRAVDARDPDVGYLKVDPKWDGLRGDVRFSELLTKLGFGN
jgi:serine/threonine-protein kinase